METPTCWLYQPTNCAATCWARAAASAALTACLTARREARSPTLTVTLGSAPDGGTVARIHLPTAGIDYGPFDTVEEPVIRSGAGPRS